MRPLETGCGSLKDGAGKVCEEEAGRDLDQDPQAGPLGWGLFYCWEPTADGAGSLLGVEGSQPPAQWLGADWLTCVAGIGRHPHQVAPDTSPLPLLAPVVLCRGRKLVAELNWLDRSS